LKPTCCCGAAFLGPPGLGGESLALSVACSQSFLTGGGTGVEKVAIETSPIQRNIKITIIFQLIEQQTNSPIILNASLQA
jgi:hypothetical protein